MAEALKAGFGAGDLAFYAEDIREHVEHEVQLFARAFGGCQGVTDRRAVFRQVQRTLGELRARLYRRYGRQAIGKLLEGE